MDADLETMSREGMIDEASLRQGIREHRDSTGHDLCWHHPSSGGLLPEKTDPMPAVPAWPKFMAGASATGSRSTSNCPMRRELRGYTDSREGDRS